MSSSFLLLSNPSLNLSQVSSPQSSQFYSFSPLDAHLHALPFERLRGKVVLIVNLASLCGYTPQFRELESLYQKYKSKGLIVLAFPCNQFLNQEPQSNENISIFCQRHFGVTFPILNKVEVNGSNSEPLFKYLKEQKSGVLGFKGIRWNFEKFLIDRNGNVTNRYPSDITPLQFENVIVDLLKQ